jgi:hypothetical protein
LHRRHQQEHQHADDGNHHEQLNERESATRERASHGRWLLRHLHFINNAIKVEVSLYAPDAADSKKPAEKKPAGPAKTDVMVTMSVAQQEIPVPPEAEDLEISEEGYPLYHHFYTKAKIAAVIEFYKKEMPAPWKRRDAAAKADDKEATLAFDTAGQEPLRLECVRDKDDVITAVRWTRSPKEGK